VVGEPYSVTARGGLSGNAVTFSSQTTDVCTFDVDGSTVRLRSAGRCTVAADQREGGGYRPADQATQSFTVVDRQPQVIRFTSSPPPPSSDLALVGGSYNVAATGGGSPNPVEFSSQTPTVCSVSNGSTVRLDARGNCRIAANQKGNTFYIEAGEQTQNFDIYDVQVVRITSVNVEVLG